MYVVLTLYSLFLFPSAQHLLESMLFLTLVLPLASCHLLSPGPPFAIHIPSRVRNSLTDTIAFARNSKLPSSADYNDCLASMCTSELCKEGIFKLQLWCVCYCMLLFRPFP